MKAIIKTFIICLSSLFQMACTSTLLPIAERPKKQQNPHLIYEQNGIDEFVVYQGYVVQFNEEKKVPNYTIHRITPRQITDSNGFSAKRIDDFFVDSRIQKFSANRADYYRTGYDRGHMVPAGDFVYSQTLKNETFTYTNVTPQLKELNRYGWKYLESAIRRKVERCNCDAYVITGVYFKSTPKHIGANKVAVPDQFYKIVFYPKKSELYAFIMDNNTLPYLRSLNKYQRTVDELEKLLGIDFFENLNDKDENRLEEKLKRFKE